MTTVEGKGTKECFKLVHDVLGFGTINIYGSESVDEQDDDISVGTGLEWPYLLQLRTNCCSVRSRVTSIVRDDARNGTSYQDG